MKRIRSPWIPIVAGAAALALLLSPGVAAAQLDHLVCFKVKDRLPVAVDFDLFAELQPEFTVKGCRIVKVTDFCVPASKLNVAPAEADVRPDVVGPPLHADYIGYLVKCRKQLAPQNKVVIDQFGTHRHRRYKVQKVFVPAKKGPPQCGTVDGKMCGGVCPDATEQCRIDPVDGACRCLPAEDDVCGGKPDKQGVCGGPCPDPLKPRCQLTVTASGAVRCECGPPPPPLCGINPDTGTCGGECPNKADKCVLKSPNDCTCMPATTPCGLDTGSPPTCSGDCPVAGDVCALDLNNLCRCGPPTVAPCGQNTLTGTCSGDCPPDTKCLLDADGNCGCHPLPCGSSADGTCGGTCPDPTTQSCKVDASGACNCDPPSCRIADVDTCGGACPAGYECRPYDAAAAFTCRCQ